MQRLSSLFLLNLCTAAVLLTALAFLLYLPFYRGFVSPSQGVAQVATADRSPIGDEVAIFGLPFFLVASLIVVRCARGVGDWITAAARACYRWWLPPC